MVILDIIMPEMGGEETYLNLKSINPRIKVLVASGYSIDDHAAGLLEQGCHGFIQKPFDIARLSQKLRDILYNESPVR